MQSKLMENQLEDAYKKHSRKQKGLSPFSYMGDIEIPLQRFNNSVDSAALNTTDSVDGGSEATGMGEQLTDKIKQINIRESLRVIDLRTLGESNFNDLRSMYETIEPRLSAQDKIELKQLLNGTDDPDMVASWLQNAVAEKNEDFNADTKLGQATAVLNDEIYRVYPKANIQVEQFNGHVLAEAEVNGELIFAASGDDSLLDRIINKEFFWGRENHLFMVENEGLLIESYKADVIDWLSNNKSAHEAAVKYFGVTNFEDVSEEDITEWIRGNKSLGTSLDQYLTAQSVEDSTALEEALSDVWVEEWWGQTDDDPLQLARDYNLRLEIRDRKGDETLYRFIGSNDDIQRARRDGYFYSLDYATDGKTSTSDSLVLTNEEKDIVDHIVDQYTATSQPISGDWNTEATSERDEIMNALGCDKFRANQIMIDYLGFDSFDLD